MTPTATLIVEPQLHTRAASETTDVGLYISATAGSIVRGMIENLRPPPSRSQDFPSYVKLPEASSSRKFETDFPGNLLRWLATIDAGLRATRFVTDMPMDVRDFIKQHSLAEDFSVFLRLSTDCFPDASQVRISRERDPDDLEAEWICVEVQVRGEVESVLEQYNRFIESTVETMSPDASKFFRFSIDIQ